MTMTKAEFLDMIEARLREFEDAARRGLPLTVSGRLNILEELHKARLLSVRDMRRALGESLPLRWWERLGRRSRWVYRRTWDWR